jgi:hypothetical protein
MHLLYLLWALNVPAEVDSTVGPTSRNKSYPKNSNNLFALLPPKSQLWISLNYFVKNSYYI